MPDATDQTTSVAGSILGLVVPGIYREWILPWTSANPCSLPQISGPAEVV